MLDPSMLKSNVKFMTKQDVLKLAERDPRHCVYDFTYDDVQRPLTGVQVLSMIKLIRFHMARARAMDNTLSDATIASALRKTHPHVDLFASNSHPTIFAKVHSRDTSDDVMKNIVAMIKVRIAVENGEADEDLVLSKLQDKLLNSCVREPAPLENTDGPI
jgi:hypothetical protein